MKPTKCPAKEKQKKRDDKERKRKIKVKTAISLLNLKTNLKLCILHMPNFAS